MLANSELGGVFDEVRPVVSLILTLRMSFPRSWTTSAQRTSMPSTYPSSSHARCTTSTTETLYIYIYIYIILVYVVWMSDSIILLIAGMTPIGLHCRLGLDTGADVLDALPDVPTARPSNILSVIILPFTLTHTCIHTYLHPHHRLLPTLYSHPRPCPHTYSGAPRTSQGRAQGGRQLAGYRRPCVMGLVGMCVIAS